MASTVFKDQLSLPRLPWLLALLGLVCPSFVHCQQRTWRWTVEDVDVLSGAGPDAGVEQTAIVADKDGNVHLSYYLPTSFGELRYAFRSAADGRWYKMTVDKELGVFSSGIALDSDGNPGICYTPRKAKYAKWDGHNWNIQEVDPGSGLNAYHCSIKFTSDDRPQLSWYLETVFALRHATLESGVWHVRSVEAGTQSGKWNSMVLGPDNLPQFAYSSFKGGELHYARFDGKEWHRVVLDSPMPGEGPRGMGASIIFDRSGHPGIAYNDLNSLKYASFDGTKWKTQAIERLPPYGDWSWKNFATSQVADHDGNIHISYESHLGLKHAWWDGTRWRTQQLKPQIENSFFESSMTIDCEDVIYISFRDPSDRSLKVAIGRPVVIQQTAEDTKERISNN